jgi:predicted Zn-dependent protease
MWWASRFVLFGIALYGALPVHAKTELLKTRLGSVVHWSSASITIRLDTPSRSLDSNQVSDALGAAVEAWNSVHAQQPTFRVLTKGQADVSIRFCKGRWQGDTIDLGKSQFSASLHDGTVNGATVEINECDHRFIGNGQAGTGYDLQAVLTHELGHVLGLGHSNSPSAIMYPNGGGTAVRSPTVEDQTTLALIYFGRSPTAAVPRSSPTPSATAPVPDDGGAFTLATRSQPSRGLPSDSITMLSLKTSAGHELMVYTCEPTLLPAMDTAPLPRDNRRGEASKHDRRGSRSLPR